MGKISLDETTLKIMDTLSRKIGNPVSINELKNKIEESYGSANYSGIYFKLQSLTEEKITTLETAGKASLVSLNFKNWFTADLLALTDIWKKIEVLKTHPELQRLISDIYVDFDDLNFTKSMSVIDAEHNLALNRAEFLILINAPGDQIKESAITIHKRMQVLQKKHSIHINTLILTTNEFLGLLKSDEANPLREMLPKRINFLSPQAFWTRFMIASEEGLRLKFETKKTEPEDISERILTYNLLRLGYREFGTNLIHGKVICAEYMITSILLRGNARRIEAIPVILAKNRINYNLLIFLSQKYDISPKLLGLLRVLRKFIPSVSGLEYAIAVLDAMGIREVKADEKSVKENLSLYSVVEQH